jgi:hypothetical protein
MKRKRVVQVAGVWALAILFSGYACQPNSYAKVGLLAKDLAASVLVAQQVEIEAYRSGFVTPEQHTTIQQKFFLIAEAGARLDTAINQAHNATTATAEIKTLTSLLADLSNNQITGIKDDKARIGIQSAILAVNTILDSISVFGSK